MTKFSLKPILLRGAAILCAAGFMFSVTGADAGECPKGKELKSPRDIENKASVGVKRETLALIDLKGWRNVGELSLRTRRLTIAPYGVVPTHVHNDRPSIVYIVSGEIIEHSALCSVEILHKAGETTPEFGPGHEHWWENRTNQPVVLTSSDVIAPEYMDRPEDM